MFLSVSLLQVPTDVEKCQDRVECFNADLKADWDRWQNNKRQDFRQLLTGMADKNIQYFEKVRNGECSLFRCLAFGVRKCNPSCLCTPWLESSPPLLLTAALK